jgi:hypothetical protein
MIAPSIEARNSTSAFLQNLFRASVSLILFMLPAGAFAAVTVSSLGSVSPTFVGPAATGCASGCNLLSGPTVVGSTASYALGSSAAAHGPSRTAARINAARVQAAMAAYSAALAHTGMPGRSMRDAVRAALAAYQAGGLRLLPRAQLATSQAGSELLMKLGPARMGCTAAGTSCDAISLYAPGVRAVKGLNAVDSGTLPTNPLGDIAPPDQGLCAGNGYVVESNNIGEVLFFNTKLNRVSGVIPLDTLMGLTAKGWSSGGDVSCNFDHANGGHWFFTEFASSTSEASGGTFAGCFAGVANTCYEVIAVTQGASPYGPYYVYTLNSNYNPAEPGAPYLLNDFTKTAVSRDAFLLFYDEFPLVNPGIGGGFFNGAQEYAFDKTALEEGQPVLMADGSPNPDFNVAIENMGTLSTPDGTCASDNIYHAPGFTCWYSVIPAMPPDPTQFDNSHGGSAFMLESLDFYGNGDTRVAVFDWTELSALDSPDCESCSAIQFGGQLFSGVNSYYDPGLTMPQKAGPIPLGDECGAAGLSSATSCPEGNLATNGDNFTQASQAQGKLWGAISSLVSQVFPGTALAENHMGAVYYEVNTAGFDHGGSFTLAGQGYVAPMHEDLSMPDLIAPDSGLAVMVFTLAGNGGPTGADGGGFYPSTAYAQVLTGSRGVLSNTIHIADLGQSPEDSFTEYLGYPGPTRPRLGDYAQGVFDPHTAKIYFANEYIQYPNCTGSAFNYAAFGTCGGTRDGFANWGTSVNSIE